MDNASCSPALIMKIRNMMDSLSKSEKAVAQYIVDYPGTVIYRSVADIADSCNVSDPTVVRACQKLGFSGYQDLKVTLMQNVLSPIDDYSEEIAPEDNIQKVVSKVFFSAEQALKFTRDTLNYDDMERVSSILINAKRISIFGLGGSNSVAIDAQHKFMRLGFAVTAYTDAHLQAIASANATEDDVIFAISHSGSSKGIVDNAQTAKNNGAKVISLTSMGKSPLSKISDITLFTAANETKYRIVALSSRIAELAIIDSLYSYIAIKEGKTGVTKVEVAMEPFKY